MFRNTLPVAGSLLGLLFLLPAAACGQDDRDTLYFGFRATINNHVADYPDDPADPIPDGFGRFCKALADRGMTFLVFPVAYREGDALKACVATDLLAGLGVPAGIATTLRDKVLLAKAVKLKIYADISELAWAGHAAAGNGGKAGPLAAMDAATVTQLLDALQLEGFDGIFADDLPSAWRPTVADYCRDKRLKLVVGDVMSPTEARFEGTWVTADENYRGIGYGDAVNATALGYSNFTLGGVRYRGDGGAGDGWDKPAVLRNVLLFRTIATRSRGALFSGPAGKLPPEFGLPPAEGAPKLYEQMAQIVRGRERLPVFNILTDLTPADFGDAPSDRGPGKFGHNLVAVAASAIAAGFEPRLTSEPLADDVADVYYLYMKGLEGERTANAYYADPDVARDISSTYLDQIRKGNKPIFLQLGTILPSSNISGTSNWMTLREYFGLNDSKAYRCLKPDEIPEQGTFNGKNYKHPNTDWTIPGHGNQADPLGAKMQWMTAIEKNDMDKDAEVLSLGYQAGNEIVLCSRRIYRGGKPNYFVNGSVLDAQAQYLLTNVLTDNHGMTEPAGYLYALGQTYTAVLAYENATANFQLPGRMTAGYAWTRYAPDGTVTKGTDRYDPKKGISNLKLETGTLVILEPKEIR